MSKNIDKKTWSEQEKADLLLGYQMGISLKVLAHVLDRTPTSINKALARFGARCAHAAPRGLRERRQFASPLTAEGFCKYLQRHSIERGYTRVAPPLDAMPSRRNRVFTCPVKGARPSLKKSGLCIVWSLDDLMKYVCQSGDEITEVEPRADGTRQFLYQGVVMNPPQLLVCVNQKRLAHGSHIIYIEGVTEF